MVLEIISVVITAYTIYFIMKWIFKRTNIIKRIKMKHRNKFAIQIAYNQVRVIRRNIAELDNALDKQDLGINQRIKHNENRRTMFHALLDLKKKIRQFKGKEK